MTTPQSQAVWHHYQLLAICYWLLAIGYWLLAIGYWLFAIGYIFNAEQPADGSCQVLFPGKQLVRGFFIRERDGQACMMKDKKMVVLGNLKKRLAIPL